MEEYQQLVRQHILDEPTFVRAVFGGRRRGHTVPWRKVIVRPLLIKATRHLQFSYIDEKQDITKNYAEQAEERLDELLLVPFKNIHVQTTEGTLQVQFTRKGKAIVHRHVAAERVEKPSLAHDRRKQVILPADRPDPFLQAIGIMTREGRVRARMRKKLQQINEFLKLLAEMDDWRAGDQPLHVVDCGCGNAYLTFAAYHYFNHILHVPARVTGIDSNGDLVARQTERSRALGWNGLSFHVSSIIEFGPPQPPDIVFALHACDTATDEALAQAVRWQSRTILSVPCCHHHLQQQLKGQAAPEQFRLVLRHNALRERLVDILTDGFRAQILRMMGYRTDVVEFISTEHTAKNLMIRAVQTGTPGNPETVQEYEALRAYWQAEPYLAELLRDELAGVTAVARPVTDDR
jgi:SAM-dependent methyltransferase